MRINPLTQTKDCIDMTELDSHADTCEVNNAARILEYTDQVAEVSKFSNTLPPLQNIPIVKAPS